LVTADRLMNFRARAPDVQARLWTCVRDALDEESRIAGTYTNEQSWECYTRWADRDPDIVAGNATGREGFEATEGWVRDVIATAQA